MARVIVLEFPDEADGFEGAIEAVRRALPELPEGSRAHMAINEDAQRVLDVFQATKEQS
jgi:hypothetical protein